MDRIDELPPPEVIFGHNQVMRLLQERLGRIAQSPVPVLILGESGTGKEIMARLIHDASARRLSAFVKLCCPAIPSTLLETELFGYEKGAFTGAYSTKRGRVEMAHQGTLFLDEIGDLSADLQAKLLQLLQDGSFSRVGGQEDRKVNLRLLSATNRNLRSNSERGDFRTDLFFRINAFTVEMPPLRERISDLPLLVDYFLSMYVRKFHQPLKPLSSDAMRLLENYNWPGNIRELENVIRSYVIMGTEDCITSELLAFTRNTLNAEIEFDDSISLKEITKRAVQGLERQIIMKVLQANHWNRKKTAEVLKISYRSLLYKMCEGSFAMARHNSRGDAVALEPARGESPESRVPANLPPA